MSRDLYTGMNGAIRIEERGPLQAGQRLWNRGENERQVVNLREYWVSPGAGVGPDVIALEQPGAVVEFLPTVDNSAPPVGIGALMLYYFNRVGQARIRNAAGAIQVNEYTPGGVIGYVPQRIEQHFQRVWLTIGVGQAVPFQFKVVIYNDVRYRTRGRD